MVVLGYIKGQKFTKRVCQQESQAYSGHFTSLLAIIYIPGRCRFHLSYRGLQDIQDLRYLG